MSEARPPLPPFTAQTAVIKARKAEDAWNSKDPEKVSLAYTEDSQWRNRSEIFSGREAIKAFLTQKWSVENGYRLIKGVWSFSDNRIAARFAYEYHNEQGDWFRAYGNENWQFNEAGLMEIRHASINDIAIKESDRKLIWEGVVRPNDYPSIDELGL